MIENRAVGVFPQRVEQQDRKHDGDFYGQGFQAVKHLISEYGDIEPAGSGECPEHECEFIYGQKKQPCPDVNRQNDQEGLGGTVAVKKVDGAGHHENERE